MTTCGFYTYPSGSVTKVLLTMMLIHHNISIYMICSIFESLSVDCEIGSPKRLVLLAEVEGGAKSGAWLAEG